MPDKLAKFLIDLSENPANRLKFDADPHAMMDAAGLNAAEQALLLTRDPARIRARYGMETVAHMTRIPATMRVAGNAENKAGAAKKGASTAAKDPSKKPAKKKKAAKKKSK